MAQMVEGLIRVLHDKRREDFSGVARFYSSKLKLRYHAEFNF